MPSPRRVWLAALAAFSVIAPAREGRAYEDAVELAAGVGYGARLGGNDELGLGDHGMAFSGTAGFGLNDAWSLRVTGMSHVVFPEPRFRRSAVFFEATYALDVVRVVPVIGAGVGAGLEGYRGQHEVTPAFTAFASLDVLLTREWLVGPELRMLALPWTGVPGAGDFSFAATVRLAYLWDRF